MRWVARSLLASSVAVMLAAGVLSVVDSDAAPAPKAAREAPRFEVDPTWPKLPPRYVFGQVSSVSIDDQGHAWVLQRPSSLRADQKDKAAPPVIEFDEQGNFVQAWGGPGQGYDWPEVEHGIYVDPKGNVWLGGNGPTDHHLVKFTKQGRFLMQLGKKGASKGNAGHHQRQGRCRHVRPYADERAVRCRRLRQPARDRVRRGYGCVQTHVGCVRQQAGR
jgi:hypothetical protein